MGGGEFLDPAEAEGEVFGEVAAAEVGLPAAGDLDHGAFDGLEGGDGCYLAGERGGVAAFVVVEQRGDAPHAQHVQQAEELLVHIYQLLRCGLGPFLVEEYLVVEDLILPAGEHSVETPCVQYGVRVRERCLVKTVQKRSGRKEQAFNKTPELLARGNVLHRHRYAALVAQQPGGHSVFGHPGDVGHPLEPEQAGILPQHLMREEEEPGAGDYAPHNRIPHEGLDLRKSLLDKIPGQAAQYHIGTGHDLGRVRRHPRQPPPVLLPLQVRNAYAAPPFRGMSAEYAQFHSGLLRQHAGAHVAQGASAADTDFHQRDLRVFTRYSLSARSRTARRM